MGRMKFLIIISLHFSTQDTESELDIDWTDMGFGVSNCSNLLSSARVDIASICTKT